MLAFPVNSAGWPFTVFTVRITSPWVAEFRAVLRERDVGRVLNFRFTPGKHGIAIFLRVGGYRDLTPFKRLQRRDTLCRFLQYFSFTRGSIFVSS